AGGGARGAAAWGVRGGPGRERGAPGPRAARGAAGAWDAIERRSRGVAGEPLERLPVAQPAEADRRRFERQLRGDLDNVLLMALRREPERRYGSGSALAGDFRRHVEGRPVQARP